MQEKIIDDKILEKMTLANVYNIFNANIFPMLNEEDIKFCKEIQKFCIELEPKVNTSEDVYEFFSELGKHGFMQRINVWKDYRPFGMKKELLLSINLSILDAELDAARFTSSVLCANALFHYFHHGGKNEKIEKIKDELMSGEKIGSLCITEPERGSDSVNMTTMCTKTDDSIIYNGKKVFTTNGPKADYFVIYGVYDKEKPRETMVQTLIPRELGVKTNRIAISSAPRIHIAQTFLEDVKVPQEFILADNGDGYKRLFEGLVPERLVISANGLGVCWGALIYGMIYTNYRRQFGKDIIKFEGVGFGLADLLSKVTAATALALQVGTIYDEKILFAEKPNKEVSKWTAGVVSQAKYHIARLSHEVCYEVQQQMGGISLTDNTPLDRYSNVSKIEEVIGGARNIQLLIIQNALSKIKKIIE
ncbi:MAG: acyl-CoA dehydrogenase [Candidatus Lokiarchaeota archaeon]|nr:acyl-CoA dehydrogenase [Candidatus Lokiarchaeota archaeon]